MNALVGLLVSQCGKDRMKTLSEEDAEGQAEYFLQDGSTVRRPPEPIQNAEWLRYFRDHVGMGYRSRMESAALRPCAACGKTLGWGHRREVQFDVFVHARCVTEWYKASAELHSSECSEAERR